MPAAAEAAEAACDRVPVKPEEAPESPEMEARDKIIAWFRGEFAAANAIIDALCGHLVDGGGAEDYKSAFAAIHRRRMNWIPILQMQKYYSIADVAIELQKVARKKKAGGVDLIKEEVAGDGCTAEIVNGTDNENDNENGCDESGGGGGGDHESEITATGSQETQSFQDHVDICTNHEECEARRAKIKMTKRFIAKESIKGHMVNVVKGLTLYEDIFTDVELSKLNDFVNELRVAGQNGELSGETFILYNQQTKGNKRELIQLGVSMFGQIKEDATKKLQQRCIEPIPPLLQSVIEHLIQWRLIPENRRPSSCIINFFDEGEYSQPFLKPPHLDQLVSTILLSESTMAFGRTLVSHGEGNYKGPLMLSVKEGSLLVMRGNSSETARHAMCSSQNKRVSIIFFKVREEIGKNNLPEVTPVSKTMTTSWQPGAVSNPYTMSSYYEPMNTVPTWGLVQAPTMMYAPVQPVFMGPTTMPSDGTGVFLPWAGGQQKPRKHLPPRAQRGRVLALPSPNDSHSHERASDAGTNSP